MVFHQIRDNLAHNLIVGVPPIGDIDANPLRFRLIQLPRVDLRVVLPPPGTHMHLIDIQRFLCAVSSGPHPVRVMEFIALPVIDYRRRSRSLLRKKSVRIGMVHEVPVRAVDPELIHLSWLCVIHLSLPELPVFHLLHRRIRPAVELADHGNRLRIRRIGAEYHVLLPALSAQVLKGLKFLSVVKIL